MILEILSVVLISLFFLGGVAVLGWWLTYDPALQVVENFPLFVTALTGQFAHLV
jgi:hypothetical protein